MNVSDIINRFIPFWLGLMLLSFLMVFSAQLVGAQGSVQKKDKCCLKSQESGISSIYDFDSPEDSSRVSVYGTINDGPIASRGTEKTIDEEEQLFQQYQNLEQMINQERFSMGSSSGASLKSGIRKNDQISTIPRNADLAINS